MRTISFTALRRTVIFMIALTPGFVAPSFLWAQGTLENPQPGSSQSGIGVLSGWVCNASSIDIVINEGAPVQVPYGSERADTVEECGDSNNGFGLLLNWNLLGSGTHTIRALADGVEFGSVTFTVTTISGEFLWGAEGSFRLPGFPDSLTDVIIRWDEHMQNFVIERVEINVPDVPVGAI